MTKTGNKPLGTNLDATATWSSQRDPSASWSYTDKHAIREITHSNPAIPIICPRPVAFRAKGFFIGLAAIAIAWFIAMITSGVMCV